MNLVVGVYSAFVPVFGSTCTKHGAEKKLWG